MADDNTGTLGQYDRVQDSTAPSNFEITYGVSCRGCGRFMYRPTDAFATLYVYCLECRYGCFQRDVHNRYIKETQMLKDNTVTLDGRTLEAPAEYSQITPEALQGGFKAADSKACFDLIPTPIFSKLVTNVLIGTPYTALSDKLLAFWKETDSTDSQITYLQEAFTEAFRLLTEELGTPTKALFAIGELYAIGKKKYAARNWEKGIDFGIVWSAAFRHLLYLNAGEKTDPVDGQLHMTSVCWNIIALIHFVFNPEKYAQFDSRQVVEVAQNKGQK